MKSYFINEKHEKHQTVCSQAALSSPHCRDAQNCPQSNPCWHPGAGSQGQVCLPWWPQARLIITAWGRTPRSSQNSFKFCTLPPENLPKKLQTASSVCIFPFVTSPISSLWKWMVWCSFLGGKRRWLLPRAGFPAEVGAMGDAKLSLLALRSETSCIVQGGVSPRVWWWFLCQRWSWVLGQSELGAPNKVMGWKKAES